MLIPTAKTLFSKTTLRAASKNNNMSSRDDEAVEVSDAEVAREELEAGDDEPSDGESLGSADDDDIDDGGDEVYHAPVHKRHCPAADYARALVALDQQTVAALKRHVGQLRGLIGNLNPMTERDCETIRKLKQVVEDINPSTRTLRDIVRCVEAMAEGPEAGAPLSADDQAHVIELVALVKSVERKMEAK